MVQDVMVAQPMPGFRRLSLSLTDLSQREATRVAKSRAL
jgi:hypothetical protein